MRTLGMGVSTSLIATAIAYWITEHHLVPAVVMAAAGIAGFLITHFFTKKTLPEAQPSIHQDVRQEANPHIYVAPQQNVYIGTHPPENIETVRENARREAMIIEYLKITPNTGYDVRELSQTMNLSMPDIREIMERLETRKIVTSLGTLDAFGGKAYFIDPLHVPAPQPPEPHRAANTVKVAYRKPVNPIEQEEQVMKFLKTADPLQQRRLRGSSSFHETELIARELNFSFRETWDALETLEAKVRVRRTNVDQARGGALWRLDDRED